MSHPDPSALRQGRLCILAAALLWSLSGAFTKLLTQPTALHLDQPRLDSLQLACFRALFAGLVLVPTVRPAQVRFHPWLPAMAVCFAVMNVLFVSAMALGTSANAIFLQYTAPTWMFLASVWLFKEPADRRNLTAVLGGLAGVAVIVAGGWGQESLLVLALGLGSGLTYAGVLLWLRVLREMSPQWLTVVNHLTAALVLAPFVWALATPSSSQWLVLSLFGAVQMGLPYLLMARGLRTVSPQEAGAITLLEPILNPVWAYLVSGERPGGWTVVGGAFIVGALAWRYRPGQETNKPGALGDAGPEKS